MTELDYATLPVDALRPLIATIPAGRIFDGLIAKHVLVWESVPGPTMDYDGPIINGPILIPSGTTAERALILLPPRGIIPWYYFSDQWSTTDRGMLNLLHHLRHVPHGWSYTVDAGYWATVDGFVANADTRPLAVARAALLWGCHVRRS